MKAEKREEKSAPLPEKQKDEETEKDKSRDNEEVKTNQPKTEAKEEERYFEEQERIVREILKNGHFIERVNRTRDTTEIEVKIEMKKTSHGKYIMYLRGKQRTGFYLLHERNQKTNNRYITGVEASSFMMMKFPQGVSKDLDLCWYEKTLENKEIKAISINEFSD